MSIRQDFEEIKSVAIHFAKEHNCNYTVILMNPDDEGNFSLRTGSTYEFVADSYFEKERPNIKILFATKDEAEQEPNDMVEALDKLYPREPEVFVFKAQAVYEMPEIYIKQENHQPWKNQNKKGRGGKHKYF